MSILHSILRRANNFVKSCALLLFIAATASSARADVFVVTNTDDDGAGSLRQAITDSNISVGVLDTINFNISGAGVKTIVPTSALPTITDPVVIDGYTQPGASQNTLAIGNNAVLLIELNGSTAGASGLNTNTSNVTVQGLVINRYQNGVSFGEGSSGSVVAGNFIGTDANGTTALGNGVGVLIFRSSDNRIGGTTPQARNLISGNTTGIQHNDGENNVIQGNYIGTNAAGTAALRNQSSGIDSGGSFSTALIGGTTAGAGNLISGNGGYGVNVSQGPNYVIQGNYIGTDATGTAAIANDIGIGAGGPPNIHIGGTEAGAGNVISGNARDGVLLAYAANALVEGNLIGTQQDGISPLGNGGSGVFLGFTTGGAFGGGPDVIGGTAPGAGNVIAFNSGNGINVLIGCYGCTGSAGQGQHTILGNSIFANGGLGIDLGGTGVTLNDEGDADEGINHLQNFPVITLVSHGGGNTTIVGTLNSTADTTFRIEFFANDAANLSGFGEGQTFIGFAEVTTDAGGDAAFSKSVPQIGEGQFVTATATHIDHGETSEFSVAHVPRLLNISTRMGVLTAEKVLIGGFIITGAGPKKVIVRGIGPSLSAFGVPGVLQDPTLELHGAVSINNDNWRSDQEAEIQATGIPPSNDAESAVVASLEPGAYTAILAGKDNTTGVGLVEVYDLDQSAGSKLANISTRGFVDTGDNVMIGGFIAGPADTGATRVLIRAIGPSLGAAGIQDALQDPALELHDVNGALLTSNDDWKDTQQSEIEATTIPPTDDRESALVQTLAPGNYTAIVRGAADTTGVGLVEVYHLQ